MFSPLPNTLKTNAECFRKRMGAWGGGGDLLVSHRLSRLAHWGLDLTSVWGSCASLWALLVSPGE